MSAPTPINLSAMAFLLACATSPDRRCHPTCPGYFVNGDTNTVERCDECASEHGYTDVADDDVWAAVKAVQAIGRAVPIDVTPETLTSKISLAIDNEYSPAAWWDAARAVTDPGFVAVLERLDEDDAISIPTAQADAFLAIAATLPAWEGPDHAPHPIHAAER